MVPFSLPDFGRSERFTTALARASRPTDPEVSRRIFRRIAEPSCTFSYDVPHLLSSAGVIEETWPSWNTAFCVSMILRPS